MEKQDEKGNRTQICDICEKEIVPDGTVWVNHIPIKVEYYNEYYKENFIYSSDSINICPKCREMDKYRNLAWELEKDYDAKCVKLIEEWKKEVNKI